ncbi:uncharacterized protein PODANS_6_11280 [Podospora anserina S mat+]|uniref:Podospora anserina S mat+ genomic DNA chromosome 6, supercontig 1 n=1 Tax=Podospora anserina (strain S / ATCC MYA-4624 / DSM 980 / FGSC 10383) TaxID=515849 RepID=B2ASU9_PODAN|nr:uncharacterized protein PODANS_6_11280 [Podospora anserina S mat+]CAP67472.1 unnamed protein product [Podospora anserina S mat+]CDP30338.1 Putative protein of unknown function [Podospora anserina S mat+]
MSRNWIIHYAHRGVKADEVFDRYIKMIPSVTQYILGSLFRKPNPTPSDLRTLLDLPQVPMNLSVPGVYINVPTSAPRNSVKGLYVGSSCATTGRNGGGLQCRVKEHLVQAKKILGVSRSVTKSTHYQLLREQGVSSNFRVLAISALRDRVELDVFSLEGIFQGLLDVVLLPDAGLHGDRFHSPSVMDYLATMRQHVSASIGSELPSFRHLGLNGAWIQYGGVPRVSSGKLLHEEWVKTNPDICGGKFCGVPRPTDGRENEWRGIMEAALCRRCRQRQTVIIGRDFYNTYPKKQRAMVGLPAFAWGPKDHEIFLAAGNANVCQNPPCDVPRGEFKATRFKGYCEQSRCSSCAKYLEKHGVDKPEGSSPRQLKNHLNPNVKAEKDQLQAEQDAYLDAGNEDKCQNDNCGFPVPPWMVRCVNSVRTNQAGVGGE